MQRRNCSRKARDYLSVSLFLSLSLSLLSSFLFQYASKTGFPQTISARMNEEFLSFIVVVTTLEVPFFGFLCKLVVLDIPDFMLTFSNHHREIITSTRADLMEMIAILLLG